MSMGANGRGSQGTRHQHSNSSNHKISRNLEVTRFKGNLADVTETYHLLSATYFLLTMFKLVSIRFQKKHERF